MKFTKGDYKRLKAAIDRYIDDTGIDISSEWKEYIKRGLSFRRFYWDIYWVTILNERKNKDKGLNNDMEFFNGINHTYYDDHIDTALKKAVKELLAQ